ncbi:MAG: UbiA family prenyltransferase [Candidatus Kapabacteria bacterium]|nr:UbiA family prenyltransferase [Ignavibacteriota bacterium]MCW5885041.1 UbiA family prenyltransferase [Candidatus Kapabacteria bacterium]
MKNDDINIPLCVDLDGTLLKTDLLYESVIYLLKKNFFYIFILPFWLAKGRYFLKFKLLEFITPNITSMPFHQDVLDYVINEKSNGRRIVLVTATAEPLAIKAAEHFDVFDEVIASKDGINLVGQNKAARLVELFGEKGFDYAGDSYKDLFVWAKSRNSMVVSDNENLLNEAEKASNVSKKFIFKRDKFKIFIKQIRVHQWVKNLLIFMPPLLAHKTGFDDYFNVIWAFLSFSFVASGIYVINDLADIESDRNHDGKKNRPAASGNISILTCLKIIPVMILSGYLMSIMALGINFTMILVAYTIITVLYSFRLKKIYLLDIIILSLLYTSRLIAGGVATGTEISPWLFSFSMFVFLSLGAMKRYTELKGLIESNKTKTRGRDYYVEDIPLISMIGISAGIVSTLVFTLYIDNPDVIKLYNSPFYLYLITPVVLYWILRMWFIAHRGMMNDDPIVFGLKDKASYIVAAIIFLIALGATL